VIRFVHNCQSRIKNLLSISSPLTVAELSLAESYWIFLVQKSHFAREIGALKAGAGISPSSPLITLNPFLDENSLLRVCGRERNSRRLYENKHPLIVHAKHPVVRLLIHSEHLRLLHAGPALLSASLSQRFHLIRGRNLIRSITRGCITCRRNLPDHILR